MFIDRIQKIAGGRKLTPWLKSIGWIANDVTRINAGAVPGSGKLQQLAEAENVNLNWLLTGQGQRHVVEHWLSDSSIARRIDELLVSAVSARVLEVLSAHPVPRALVIEAQLRDRTDPYFVILTGPAERLTDAALARHHACFKEHCAINFSRELAIALHEGRIGRTELIDPVGGIFLAEADKIRLRPPQVHLLTPRDQLHTAIDAMSDAKAARWLALLSGED